MGGRRKPKWTLEEASRPTVAPYDTPLRGWEGRRVDYGMGVARGSAGGVLILLNAKLKSRSNLNNNLDVGWMCE